VPPKTFAAAHQLSVKIQGRCCGKMGRLDDFGRLLHPVGTALEYSQSSEHEVAITRIGGVARFVKVEQVHSVKRQKKGG
jgi:hypothetical protein